MKVLGTSKHRFYLRVNEFDQLQIMFFSFETSRRKNKLNDIPYWYEVKKDGGISGEGTRKTGMV